MKKSFTAEDKSFINFKNPSSKPKQNDFVSSSTHTKESPLRKYLETFPDLLITTGRRRVTLLGTTSSSFETSTCSKSMEVLRDLVNFMEENWGKLKIGYWVIVDLHGFRKRRELWFAECIRVLRVYGRFCLLTSPSFSVTRWFCLRWVGTMSNVSNVLGGIWALYTWPI